MSRTISIGSASLDRLLHRHGHAESWPLSSDLTFRLSSLTLLSSCTVQGVVYTHVDTPAHNVHQIIWETATRYMMCLWKDGAVADAHRITRRKPKAFRQDLQGPGYLENKWRRVGSEFTWTLGSMLGSALWWNRSWLE